MRPDLDAIRAHHGDAVRWIAPIEYPPLDAVEIALADVPVLLDYIRELEDEREELISIILEWWADPDNPPVGAARLNDEVRGGC